MSTHDEPSDSGVDPQDGEETQEPMPVIVSSPDDDDDDELVDTSDHSVDV